MRRDGRRDEPRAPMIEYADVHKAFDVAVLSGVTLAVEEGEILSIVGPSGMGKSVLLKTTIGLIVPDLGDVRVAGESVFAAGRGALEGIRRKVGYVFQNAALFDSMSVHENVAQGCATRSRGPSGARRSRDGSVALSRE